MSVSQLLENSTLDEEWSHLKVNKLSVRSVVDSAPIQAKLSKVDANTASLAQHPTYTKISTNATNYEGDAKHFQQEADGIKVLIEGDYKVEFYAQGTLTLATDSLYATWVKNSSTAETAGAKVFIQSSVGTNTPVSISNSGGEVINISAGTTLKLAVSTSASPSGGYNTKYYELKLTKVN